MNRFRSAKAAAVALAFLASSACAPEVGSEAWCEAMNEQATGDWTANEAADYARHCLFDRGR